MLQVVLRNLEGKYHQLRTTITVKAEGQDMVKVLAVEEHSLKLCIVLSWILKQQIQLKKEIKIFEEASFSNY